MLTPSRAESPPIVLAGLDMLEFSSFSDASPAYELVMDCDKAYSRALSILSSHSCDEYLLPSGSLVVFLGSSKTYCFSRWACVSERRMLLDGAAYCFHKPGGEAFGVLVGSPCTAG
jgi:hypothetical protein